MLVLWLLLAGCSRFVAPTEAGRSPLEARGRSVFDSYCSRCHATTGETVIVGPSLAGIATRAGNRIDGMDAEAYIRDSILNPRAYTVDGFPEGVMPSDLGDQISPEEMEALVAYLLTLK